MQRDLAASEDAHQQALQTQEVLALEACRAQSTARQVLSQLADDHDATSLKASRLSGVIQDLRAEKKDLALQVHSDYAARSSCIPLLFQPQILPQFLHLNVKVIDIN